MPTQKPVGFIMVGQLNVNYQQLGIVISKGHKKPSKCIQNLLNFNQSSNEGGTR